MTSKNSSNKVSQKNFVEMAKYLGISIDFQGSEKIDCYVDLEKFFVAGTYNLVSSRVAEGFLCWLLEYGHLLSPSKTRRLLQSNTFYDPSILGGFLTLITEHKINYRQWNIIKPFVRKSKQVRQLVNGPAPRKANMFFLKYNIVAHNYDLNQDKFLAPICHTYKTCIELKNRGLFGSVVNADVVSFLKWDPQATPYEISKGTYSHRARVFKVYENIKKAI